jgi:hypothetical protein
MPGDDPRDGSALLEGVRVLEMSSGERSTGLAAAFCTRLFADHGADVILAGPPGGSPLRHTGPSLPDPAVPDRSELFWHLNTDGQAEPGPGPGRRPEHDDSPAPGGPLPSGHHRPGHRRRRAGRRSERSRAPGD